MKSKSLVSIDQCSKEDILRILDNARKFEANPNRKVLEGKVAATLFFEPSTRTRLSSNCGEPVGRPCDRFLRRFHD